MHFSYHLVLPTFEARISTTANYFARKVQQPFSISVWGRYSFAGLSPEGEDADVVGMENDEVTGNAFLEVFVLGKDNVTLGRLPTISTNVRTLTSNLSLICGSEAQLSLF